MGIKEDRERVISFFPIFIMCINYALPLLFTEIPNKTPDFVSKRRICLG
jgi:hypothetical protein